MKYIDIKFYDSSLNKRDWFNAIYDVVLYSSRSEVATKIFYYRISQAEVQGLIDKYKPLLYTPLCNRVSLRFKMEYLNE